MSLEISPRIASSVRKAEIYYHFVHLAKIKFSIMYVVHFI